MIKCFLKRRITGKMKLFIHNSHILTHLLKHPYALIYILTIRQRKRILPIMITCNGAIDQLLTNKERTDPKNHILIIAIRRK